jgi:hypothetical protein
MVHAIVREGVANRQEETDPNSEADQLLTRCVRPIVDITGSRVFFVDRDDRSVVGSAIDELLEKRLIDQFPISNMAPGMATRYDAFIVHYGLWLGWRHCLQAYGNYSLIEIPVVQLADVKKYTLDTSLIEKGFLTCSNCGDVFSVTSRPYKVAGLCPQCFKPVVS